MTRQQLIIGLIIAAIAILTGLGVLSYGLSQGGTLPGAVHAPRGFLEFLADPECPMHNKALAGRKLVLFCASGGRSTLAAKTLQEMGIADVCHVAGGIAAWSAAGGPIQK